MGEGTPRFHTAEAALAYEQGKRDALREAAQDIQSVEPEVRSNVTAALWLSVRATTDSVASGRGSYDTPTGTTGGR